MNNTAKKRIDRRNRNKEITFKIFALIAIVGIITIMISIKGISVKASDDSNKTKLYKYYTSVDINSNDTLWTLEDQYNNGSESKQTYINNIMELNNLTSDTIYSGKQILVYYFSPEER